MRGGGAGGGVERKEGEYDRARSFEQQNVPKASLPSPSFLSILHGGEERKHLKETERSAGRRGRKRRRGRERFAVEASWSGSELPLSVKL